MIREAIASKSFANIIVATGASQFEVLAALVKVFAIVISYFALVEFIN